MEYHQSGQKVDAKKLISIFREGQVPPLAPMCGRPCSRPSCNWVHLLLLIAKVKRNSVRKAWSPHSQLARRMATAGWRLVRDQLRNP